MLSAFMTLMPILDFLSDLAMFNVLLAALDYGWAALVLLIIVLSFRFQSLYAYSTPRCLQSPSLSASTFYTCPSC